MEMESWKWLSFLANLRTGNLLAEWWHSLPEWPTTPWTYTEVFVGGVFVLSADEAASQDPPEPKTQHHNTDHQQDGPDHCGPCLLQQAGVT